MMIKGIFITILIIVFNLGALACTLCNSETAREARTMLFDGRFFINIAIGIIPFLICFAVVYWIYNNTIKESS